MPSAPPETIETEALALLRELAGPDADFREHQLDAVTDLVADRRRVLVRAAHGLGQERRVLPRHRAAAPRAAPGRRS